MSDYVRSLGEILAIKPTSETKAERKAAKAQKLKQTAQLSTSISTTTALE
jgi:hypothetical protein